MTMKFGVCVLTLVQLGHLNREVVHFAALVTSNS